MKREEMQQKLLNVHKNEIVGSFFVNTADQDYILARIAHDGKMGNAFFWAAGQAIEKYLKASLLLNGKSSIKDGNDKEYSHDLIRLFNDVNKYASDLFPERLTEPSQFEAPSWLEEAPLEFLERIKRYTNPDGRYNLFGCELSSQDLFHLDQFVFAARRVAFRLDAYPYITEPDPSLPSVFPSTVREKLMRHPEYQPRRDGRLDKIIKAGPNHALYDAALNSNYLFAPSDYKHKKIRLYSHSESSALWNAVGLPLDIFRQNPNRLNAEDAEPFAELADWIVENIKLPKPLKDDLRKASTEFRERASSILSPKPKETQ